MRKLVQSSNSRRDPTVYMLLLVGAGFVYTGLTVDPASNCGLGRGECAPWLVPVAFAIGIVLAGLAMAMLVHARNWGSRLDLETRTLWWWDNNMKPGEHAIALDQVGRIRIRRRKEQVDLMFLHARNGTLLHFPAEGAVPYDPEQWAYDLCIHFPHIRVELDTA